MSANFKLCGGTYGFLDSLRAAMNRVMPDRVVVGWDGFLAGKLRYNIYKPYKANRNKNWESEKTILKVSDIVNYEDKEKFEILSQKIDTQAYLEELFIRQIEEDYVEADDLIASYILNNKDPDVHFYIYCRDRDFNQLISENVSIINPDYVDIITINNFREKKGYIVENELLFKCFEGDKSDGIPGINGISKNTLIKLFPSIIDEKYTYKRMVEECYELKKKKKLKTYDKIIDSELELYRNAKLMNLKAPFMNQSAVDAVKEIRDMPLNLDLSIEQAMNMFAKDGFNQFIGDSNLSFFFGPFYSLMAKEKEFSLKNN